MLSVKEKTYTLMENTFDNLIVKSNILEHFKIKNSRIFSLDVSECVNLKSLSCDNNEITELKLNDELEKLFCSNNNIIKLILNDKLEILDCSNNHIKELKLNNDLEILDCSINNITKLELNNKLEILHCSLNNITKLELNNKLEMLNCDYNQITELKLNNNLEYLNCKKNKLKILQVNKILYKKIINKENVLIDKNVNVYYDNSFKKCLDNDLECIICYEKENLILTNCNHHFHYECLLKTDNDLCPYCRQYIN